MSTLKRKWAAIAAAIGLVFVTTGLFAGVSSHPPHPWAFANRSAMAQSPVIQVLGHRVMPDAVATSRRFALVRHAPTTEISPALRAAVTRTGAEGEAHVAVDLTRGKVAIARKGAEPIVLAIEIRSAGKVDTEAIAHAAQTVVEDGWIEPTAIVVNGDKIGTRLADGEVLWLKRSKLDIDFEDQAFENARAQRTYLAGR